MEQLVLPSGKVRRRYSPDHSVFSAGNALRCEKFYQESGVEMEDLGAVNEDEVLFVCRLFNCNGVGFYSLRAYEEHYDLSHRNICIECHRSFLSYRFLDIHISETHDAFFRILAQRQPMYVCLVDGCVQVFKHPDKRSKHLVKDHGYPQSFTTQVGRAARKKNARARKTTATAQKTSTVLNEEQQAKIVEVKKAKAKARKEKRRVQKKLQQQEVKDRSDIMEDVQPPGPISLIDTTTSDTAEDDVEMASRAEDDTAEAVLVDQMSALRIPKTLSFGRRQQRHR